MRFVRRDFKETILTMHLNDSFKNSQRNVVNMILVNRCRHFGFELIEFRYPCVSHNFGNYRCNFQSFDVNPTKDKEMFFSECLIDQMLQFDHFDKFFLEEPRNRRT